jgi:hypothetical protein
MMCVPAVRADVLNDAVPLLSTAEPSTALPSMKLTVPPGIDPGEETVVVKVTWPSSIVVLTLEAKVIAGVPFEAVPLSGNAAEIPPSAVMFMMPARNPYPVGAKLTEIVQLVCAGSAAGQFVVKGNSARFVALTLKWSSGSAVPEFFRVTVCPALGVPTEVTEKLNCEIEIAIPGGIADAESATTPTVEEAVVDACARSAALCAREIPPVEEIAVPEESVTVPVIAPVLAGVTVMFNVHVRSVGQGSATVVRFAELSAGCDYKIGQCLAGVVCQCRKLRRGLRVHRLDSEVDHRWSENQSIGTAVAGKRNLLQSVAGVAGNDQCASTMPQGCRHKTHGKRADAAHRYQRAAVIGFGEIALSAKTAQLQRDVSRVGERHA